MVTAITMIGRARRAVDTVREVKAAVQSARDTVQNKKNAAEKVLTAIDLSRGQLETMRNKAVGDINNAMRTVREEEATAKNDYERDALRAQLAALAVTKNSLCKTYAECMYDLEIEEIEEQCQKDCDAIFVPKVIHVPLTPNVQETFPHEGIRRFGCYYLSLVRWAEEINGAGFGFDRVIEIYNEFIHAGFIRDDNIIDMRADKIERKLTAFILNPVAILNRLQHKIRFTQVSISSQKGAMPDAIEAVRSGSFSHFVLHLGNSTWDSLGGNAANYTHEGWRVFV